MDDNPGLAETPNRTVRRPSSTIKLVSWLGRYHAWGLVPLLAAGLFLRIGALTVRAGILMLIAGGVGIFAGTLLRIICRTFAATDRLDLPADEPLTTEGPYALTRNPVYLSEVAIALGIAMMSRMPWLILVTIIASVAVYAPIIDLHEARLRQTHPKEFTAYSRLVPRWFSLRNLFDRDTYRKSHGRVPLLRAVRGESLTMLIALAAILAFLAKANLELFL